MSTQLMVQSSCVKNKEEVRYEVRVFPPSLQISPRLGRRLGASWNLSLLREQNQQIHMCSRFLFPLE